MISESKVLSFTMLSLTPLVGYLLNAGKKKDPLAFGRSERYKVAVGIAEALLYLHNTCSQPVIHRDVKSSNILLSDDFEPQVLFLFPLDFLNSQAQENIDVHGLMFIVCSSLILDSLNGHQPPHHT